MFNFSVLPFSLLVLLYLVLPFYEQDFRVLLRITSYVFIFLGFVSFLIYKKIFFEKLKHIYSKQVIRFIRGNGYFYTILAIYILHLTLLLNLHKNSLFLTENDFISMAEVLNQTLQGNFFRDVFHGNSENGNYLAHHFSPAILVLSPFLLFHETRIGYGYGLIFFTSLSFIGFYININKLQVKKKLLLLLLFTINLYNYRLFTSYHFEILFLCFALFWYWSISNKKITLEIIFFILMLTLKEDISIYIVFYSFFFLFQKNKLRFVFYFTIPFLYYFIFIPYITHFIDQSNKVNWLENWGEYGHSHFEIIYFLLKNPSIVLSKFFIKKNVWIDFLGSFSFLSLGNYASMFSMLPILFLHILSNRIWHNSLYHYYSYSILPITWIGVLHYIKKFRVRSFHILVFFGISLYFSSLDAYYPLKFPKPNFELDSILEVSQKIPKNVDVQVSHHLGVFLSRTNSLFPLQQNFLWKEYILFHPSPFLKEEENSSLLEFLENAEKMGKIEFIIGKKSVKLYRKVKIH